MLVGGQVMMTYTDSLSRGQNVFSGTADSFLKTNQASLRHTETNQGFTQDYLESTKRQMKTN